MADLIQSPIATETINCTSHSVNLNAAEVEAILIDAVMAKCSIGEKERLSATGEVKFAIRFDKDNDVHLLDAAAVTVSVHHGS